MDLEQVRPAGRMVFAVHGLWCTSCAMALQRVLLRLPGVTSASVNFTSGSALLTWDPDSIDFTEVFARAEALGYELAPLQSADDGALARQAARIRMQLLIAVVFGMWSMLGSWVLYLNADQLETGQALGIAWAVFAFGLPVVGYAGLDFYRAASRTLRAGLAGMDALITLGVFGSVLVTLWELLEGRPQVYMDAATMLITFLLAGRLIEIHARQQSRLAVDALKQLAPEVVTLIDEPGAEPRVCRLDEVQVGHTALVRANERIAVDGEVIAGSSTLDRSLMTGESLPAPANVGDTVLAGTVNLQGALTLRVTAVQGQRRIDLLGLRMLELFGARSSLSETAERFVRWLLPIVLVVALAALARYLWIGMPADRAILGALGILVAACPCAVGLAMPLAYTLACRQAAEQGILLRDPVSVEGLAQARVIAFDKTGTLTSGKLALRAIDAAPGCTEDQLLRLAIEAESVVSHPIAEALRRAGAQRELPLDGNATQHRAHPRGVSMQTDEGALIRVGARDWLLECGVQAVPQDEPGVIHIARDANWLGALHFHDSLRPEARGTLQALRAQGTRLWLITGDTAAAAQSLQHELGVPFEQIHAQASPEDKATLLRTESAAFVGDGANDGLVLASAACGVAIPGASTVAVAAAGVVIAQGGLAPLMQARRIALRMVRIGRQNLAFSLIYNVAVVALFFATGVTPFAAAVAMLLSSLSVLLNTSRLMRGSPPGHSPVSTAAA